jgi:predicted RNA-binding protein YlqC (UPF0109 family)
VKELLEVAARGLVREPGRVRVTQRDDAGEVCLELEVAPADRGRVIGRQGRTADALRIVLEAVAKARGERCRLEILE